MRRSPVLLLAAWLLVSCQWGTGPIESTSSTPSTTTTLAAPEAEWPIYLFFEGYPVAPGPHLAAVSRVGTDDLYGALVSLLVGATEEEVTMGLSSTIPAGTRLLGVEVTEGVAVVDLSREFESGGGTLSMMGRVAQIVYTATRFGDVHSVRFLVEGTPVDTLGGEGLVIDQPQTRSIWSELIPPILIEEPSWGSAVSREVRLVGTAELESGTMSFVIVDAEGLIIHEGEITVTPGERSEFAVSVVLPAVPNPGTGSIIAWEWAPDGSQRHVLEYPLTLVD
jgi:hypothetical protein